MKNPKIARSALEELPVVNPIPDEAFWEGYTTLDLPEAIYPRLSRT
jgi:hypothetical protein